MAYVYLIVEEPHPGEALEDWTKIGATKNAPEWRRDTNMAPGNSSALPVVAAFKYATEVDAWAAESRAHQRFASVRGRQKWFRIPWLQGRSVVHPRRRDPSHSGGHRRRQLRAIDARRPTV